MFLSHAGEILIRGLSYLTAGRNLGENAKCYCKGGLKTARGLESFSQSERFKASGALSLGKMQFLGGVVERPSPTRTRCATLGRTLAPVSLAFPICNMTVGSTFRNLFTTEDPFLYGLFCGFFPWIAEERPLCWWWVQHGAEIMGEVEAGLPARDKTLSLGGFQC